MASHLPLALIPLLIILSLFLSSSHSALTCTTQKIPSNRTFTNCTNLPTLDATLHYTFNATNNTLSVAYSATPPTPTGYVAWGLNLVGGGMIGTQAFIAYPSTTSVTVLRFNLTAYKSIDEVKAFTYESYNVSAEHTNGVITIYATVKIPETATNVTHVWQVGPVKDGKPSIHDTKPANLQSKAALPVKVEAAAVSGNATAPEPASEKKNGVGKRFHFGWVVAALMMGLVVVVVF